MLNKKAAMFGLDARIALAIFGALSVITGAALFSAIKDAKVVKVVTELSEVGKSYDAYYLDTGGELDVVASNARLEIQELVTSSKGGWKGPYISYPVIVNHTLNHPEFGNVFISELRDGDWAGETQAAWADANCVDGTVTGNCGVWVGMDFMDPQLIESVDSKVDNGNGGASGDLRYIKTTRGEWRIFLKARISNRY